MDGQSASSRLPSQETDKHQAWSSTERCATSGLRLRHSSAALRGGGLVSWFYAPALDQAGQGRTVQDRTPRKEDEQGTLHISSGYPASVENYTNECSAPGGRDTAGPLLLEARRTAFAARLKSLDEAHPLAAALRRIATKLPKACLAAARICRRADCASAECIENETAKKFRDWLQALSPRTLVVYSDGSRSTEGHAGYGYVVHRDGSTVLRDKGRLGPAEIFDAEAKGNEEADALAKAGASLPEPADNVPTLAHLRKIARQQPEEAFKAWWEASAPERYRDLRLKATTSCPSELALSRPLLRLVTTMRD
ncbi:hypothetical protein HRG_009458 [Hirsutella rhossiliensis]